MNKNKLQVNFLLVIFSFFFLVTSCKQENHSKRVFDCLEIIIADEMHLIKEFERIKKDEKFSLRAEPYSNLVAFADEYTMRQYNLIKDDTLAKLNYSQIYSDCVSELKTLLFKNEKLFLPQTIQEFKKTYLKEKEILTATDAAFEIINIRHYFIWLIAGSVSARDFKFYLPIYYYVDKQFCDEDTVLIKVQTKEWRSIMKSEYLKLAVKNKRTGEVKELIYNDIDQTVFQVKVPKKELNYLKFSLKNDFVNAKNLADSTEKEIREMY